MEECLEALPSWDAFASTEGRGEEDVADDRLTAGEVAL